MGPSNVALVKLSQADQKLREAQARLDAATKDVRLQERRVNDLAEKLKLAQSNLKTQQSTAGQLDLDLRSRDAHIEKLRTQQQVAKNNKEYQTFLVEINTQKVDRGKIEEEAIAVMEAVEKGQAEAQELSTSLENERGKLAEMKNQIGNRITTLQADIDALKPARAAAAAAVSPRGREEFDRLADRFDGEAMSAISKPDRRREEYLCTACMMSLVVDVYNKLHTRDDLVFCPSCRRMLYIPDDLPPELAVGTKTARSTAPKSGGRKPKAEKATAAPSAGGPLEEILAAAQGESVRGARDADQSPVDCIVTIDGQVVGDYKGKSAENLQRVIRFRMEEAGLAGAVEVTERPTLESSSPQNVDATNAPSAPSQS